jgi:3-oxoacid CoA-transferase subunit B
MTLIELADGVTVDEIKAKTAADFKVALNGGQSNKVSDTAHNAGTTA